MKVKVAIEYKGYLNTEPVAVDEEIDKLDLTAKVEHFDSWGALEPIFSLGMGDKYEVKEIDIPEWLLEGVQKPKEYGRWYGCGSDKLTAAKIVLGYDTSFGLYKLINRKGQFFDSLREFFKNNGFLSKRQEYYVYSSRY
jgi:hypothetical protein